MTLAFFVLVVMAILVPILTFFLVRSIRINLRFDELVGYLMDDIETNIAHFEKLRHSMILEGSDEVRTAHHNMIIMGKRLDEFMKSFHEISGRIPKKKVSSNPPVVV